MHVTSRRFGSLVALVGILGTAACEHTKENSSLSTTVMQERRAEAGQHPAHEALALIFDRKLLVQTGPAQWHLRAPSLGEKGMCRRSAFQSQPHTSGCTGVLIRPQVLVTTSSCARRQACSDMGIVFGFDLDSVASDPKMPSAQQIARCQRVDERPNGLSLVWLQGAPQTKVTPAQIAATAAPTAGQTTEVDVLSHPAGIPAKWTRTTLRPPFGALGQAAQIDASPSEVSDGAAVFAPHSSVLVGIVRTDDEAVINGEGCGAWHDCTRPPCRQTVLQDFGLDER